MDEREVALLEGRVRRSLRSLEDLAVPTLAALRARRRASSWTGRAGAAVVVTVVLVVALAAGDRLAAFRSERAAASPPGSALPVAPLAPDPRYGYLVRAAGGAHAIVDETGREVVAPFTGLLEAVTSPDGRRVALWVNTGKAYGLRFFDGIGRSLGPIVYQTSEHYVRSNQGMAWASDSSAVVVVTTAAATSDHSMAVQADLTAVDLRGASRSLGSLGAYAAQPLAWDVARGVVYLRSAGSLGGRTMYGAFTPGTAVYDAREVSDAPLAADGAARYVVSSVNDCAPGCRTYVVHDAATYAPISTIALPRLVDQSGTWLVRFLPRSSDLIVSYSTAWTSTRGVFVLARYPDAGRAPRVDLGEMTVDAPSGGVATPNAVPRADGSAVVFTRSKDSANVATTGWLVGPRGERSDMSIEAPVASVILDSSLQVGSTPMPSGRAPVPATVARDAAVALVRGLSDVVRVDRIDARLVPWSEFAPVGMGVDMTGGPLHGGGFPPEAVWAVAVAGDISPSTWGAPLGTPRRHFGWSLWGINATRLQVTTLKVGDGPWPPGYDALADHAAVALPSPAPSPQPIRFEQLVGGARDSAPVIVSLAASDPEAQHLWAVVLTGSRAPSAEARPPATALVRSDDGGRTWTPVTGAAPFPYDVAAIGSTVLVSDIGYGSAAYGTSTTGGLWVSTDAGASWVRATADGAARLFVARSQGRVLFLAEHPWVSRGAATGPSRIFASSDGKSWREIGTVPGPAAFAERDVPLVTWGKNVPGDGFSRVEGGDMASLRLIPVPGSLQAGSATLVTTPDGSLWSVANGGTPYLKVRRTKDLVSWQDVSAGLGGSVAGLFVLDGQLYAIGSGAYRWDGVALWQPVPILVSKVDAVFQLGDHVFVHGIDGTLWRSPRP